MAAELSSSLVGPRVGTVCPLDRPPSRAGLVRASSSTGLARTRRCAVVHVRTRSSRLATPSGLCHRPRRWSSSDAQPRTPAVEITHSAESSPSTRRFVSDRGSAGSRTTIIRRTDVRSRPDSGEGVDQLDQLDQLDQPLSGRRLIAAVHWYQRAAEGRPSPCRFTPSCSCYAVEALETHGARHGLWLTIRRLLRCRPFGPSGFDPVPLRKGE